MRQRTTFMTRSTLAGPGLATMLALGAGLSTLPALADAPALAERLEVNGQPMPVERVTETPMEGIYQVRLENGESFYSNADGSYFLVGDLFENGGQGLVNLTEQAKNQERVEALAAVPERDRFVYRGVDEPRATVVVFTDPTCPYCERLHETLPELNERGIAVHYLAFPRAGMESDAAATIQRAWCSDNRTEAMSRAQRREPVSGEICDNPVAEQYQLGMALGVQGTPAIILPDGRMVPGFVPPDRLADMLGLND
ncbi:MULTISPECIES: DsbC family protein [unclassified Halomonas]|uniref:DsbC family protein n=1 Tax=unclassified Halomonas TaxID=2609666 RepID=UPI00209CAEED|nr:MULTISPECIES: DsbC family protein [unclassified Halomonas]MCP1315456.1 DsbC family protein [Halomonas sp. 707D7]MCP1326657.1 DsbC family protein [Halomonas sp. 707D4]